MPFAGLLTKIMNDKGRYPSLDHEITRPTGSSRGVVLSEVVYGAKATGSDLGWYRRFRSVRSHTLWNSRMGEIRPLI
jgi:hypothetical protein